MPPTLQELGIDKLSIDDRIALLVELEESIVQEKSRTPLTKAQQTELFRRIADSEANPDAVIPWEVVYAEALARLQVGV